MSSDPQRSQDTESLRSEAGGVLPPIQETETPDLRPLSPIHEGPPPEPRGLTPIQEDLTRTEAAAPIPPRQSVEEVPDQPLHRSTTLPGPGRARATTASSGTSGIAPSTRPRGQTTSTRPQVSALFPWRTESRDEPSPRTRRLSGDGGEAESSSVMRRRTSNASSISTRRRFVRAPTMATMVRRPTALTTAISSGDPNNAFTLAGPVEGTVQAAQAQPYVDPGYLNLNPAYVQPTNNRPVWGLAKPLPRVLRPGMVPAPSELDVNQQLAEAQAAAAQQPSDLDVEKGPVSIKPIIRRPTTLVTPALRDARSQRENDLLQRRSTITTQRPTSTSQRMSRDTRRPSVSPMPMTGNETSEWGDDEDKRSQHQVNRTYSFAPSQPSGRDHFYTQNPDPFSTPVDEQSPKDDDEETNSLPSDDDVGEDDWSGLRAYYPTDELHNHHTHWSVVRTRFREPFAEFLGGFVQMTMAFCADLSVSLSGNTDNFAATYAWGFATMCGIYIAGGISGAHLNPAISILLYVYRGFPLRKVPMYIFSQTLAAFLAALLAFALFRDSILAVDGSDLKLTGTAGCFITKPEQDYIGGGLAFGNELVATAFLAVIILALGDDSNAPPGAGMNALVIGFVITILCMAFAWNTAAAMNPARDFGPRLALLAVGYGKNLFTNAYWFYGPWVATILGAIIGGAIYDIFIFVGGESPINYPRKRMWRAGHKWKKRWGKRLKGQEIDPAYR